MQRKFLCTSSVPTLVSAPFLYCVSLISPFFFSVLICYCYITCCVIWPNKLSHCGVKAQTSGLLICFSSLLSFSAVGALSTAFLREMFSSWSVCTSCLSADWGGKKKSTQLKSNFSSSIKGQNFHSIWMIQCKEKLCKLLLQFMLWCQMHATMSGYSYFTVHLHQYFTWSEVVLLGSAKILVSECEHKWTCMCKYA